MSGEKDKKPLVDKDKMRSYLKYSGLAFQLLGLILIGYFIGDWIDDKMGTVKPYWTAGVIVFILLAFMISMIYNLTKK